ncbi:hypothetical protein [Rivibacter subsaxonicus]|uniref:SnoaL-like protein n=1 Tax=Rivibacter subsaxonicus TaxID=457575 RepID=A0A4Q7W0Q8_9BURK|nr:hypothetical protein [Rivibacter subsaxonicus]RZU02099.1 hypothetical protein EV670_0118 [Rivibacter subsaxonicus]
MDRQQLIDFFDRYRAAFDRLDGDAVADCWHTPSAIADSRDGHGHGRVTVWTEEAPMRANMQALCAVYREAGFARTEFELLEHLAFGPDHMVAHLRWTLWRRDGSLLQRFGTAYQLLRGADGWRVFGATAYQEDISEMKRHVAQ